MIELKLIIEDVDYNSIADAMAPMIIEQMNNENMPGWVKMMLLGSGMNADGLKKLMSRFSGKKLEAMAVSSLNKNGDKAAEFLENMAKKQGVNVKITDVSAKQL